MASEEEVKEQFEGVKKFAREMLNWLNAAVRELMHEGDVVNAWEELQDKYHLNKKQQSNVKDAYWPVIEKMAKDADQFITSGCMLALEITPSVWVVLEIQEDVNWPIVTVVTDIHTLKGCAKVKGGSFIDFSACKAETPDEVDCGFRGDDSECEAYRERKGQQKVTMKKKKHLKRTVTKGWE